MSTGQRGTKHGGKIPGWWQRMRWRWKLTMAGFAMGALACGLWAGPAAVIAFRGGYTTHGWIYTITVAAVMVMATGGMHYMGIRHERDFDGAG